MDYAVCRSGAACCQNVHAHERCHWQVSQTPNHTKQPLLGAVHTAYDCCASIQLPPLHACLFTQAPASSHLLPAAAG